MAFYGLGLNSGIVIHAIGYGRGANIYEKLHNQAIGTVILTAAGSLPGYWTAVLTIDTIGRKPLQIFGFLLLTVIFCILGFTLNHLSEGAVLALYIVGQFLFNAGPNTTTFVVPGECFPTRYRSTGHGLSAAMGKIGAIVAQVISIVLLEKGHKPGCVGNACSPYLDRLLKLFALFMLLGTFVSLLIPETKGMTLEELSGEARTSYNSGCNGSINLDSPRTQPWNPFKGGQPAGFAYPRNPASRSGKNRRSKHTNSNSSDEASSEHQRRLRFWKLNRRMRNSSNASTEIALRNRGTYEESIGEAGSSSHQGNSQQQVVPTWVAGWGRIDRGDGVADNVQLQDVGMLLRPL